MGERLKKFVSSSDCQSLLNPNIQGLSWLFQNVWHLCWRWEQLKCLKASLPVSLSSQWSLVWSLICLAVHKINKEHKEASKTPLQYKLHQRLASLHLVYVSHNTYCSYVERAHFIMMITECKFGCVYTYITEKFNLLGKKKICSHCGHFKNIITCAFAVVQAEKDHSSV